MKSIYWLIAVVCVTAIAAPSTARAAKADGKKAKLIAKYDKNGNGTIDGDEMVAFREDFKNDEDGALKRYDKDQDGKLSDQEITAIKPGAEKPGSKKAKQAEKSAEQSAAKDAPNKAEDDSDSEQAE